MLRKLKRELNELQAQHSGQSAEQIESDSDRDRWFTSEQALDYGLIDHVVATAAALPVRDDPIAAD